MAQHLPPFAASDFGWGVITSQQADVIPDNASPRGWNANLVSIGGGRAVVEKRRGFKTVNSTAITGATAILGQHEFERRTAGSAAFTRVHLLYSQNGRIDILKSDNTTEPYDSGKTTPFASGDTPPDFVVANNECFMMNGVANWKATFTDPDRKIYKVGLTRPSAPTLGTTGTGMTGTYDVRLTFYNSYTGLQSSASNTSTQVVTNQQVRVTLPTATATDERATHVRVGVRKQGLQSEFFQVAEVTLGTTPYDINQTDNQLLALTTIFPDTAENDPPPVLSHMVWRKQRAFMVGPNSPSDLYYSQLNQPEAVDPENFEPVGKDDGESVHAIVDAFERVILLKDTSIWSLRGEDPQTWIVDKEIPGYGTRSHRSVRFVAGKLYWWDHRFGPMAWAGPGTEPEAIGQALISDSISPDTKINYAKADRVVCSQVTAPGHELVVWATAEKNPEGEGSFTNNGIMLPFNYRLGRWASEKWNPLDVASLLEIEDANGKHWLYVGGYYGQLFRYADADADGVNSGTKNGTVTSATSTTLTDSTAAFDTTGAGLKGRYVYAVAPGGITVQRRRIGSNTSTQLTLDTGLTWSTTPTTAYTYVVGGPDWQWDTKVALHGDAFLRKRFRFAQHQLIGSDVTTAYMDVFLDHLTSSPTTRSIAISPSGGLWDSGTWDTSTFDAQSFKPERTRIGLSGLACRLRFRNNIPGKRIILAKVGITAEAKSEHLG